MRPERSGRAGLGAGKKMKVVVSGSAWLRGYEPHTLVLACDAATGAVNETLWK